MVAIYNTNCSFEWYLLFFQHHTGKVPPSPTANIATTTESLTRSTIPSPPSITPAASQVRPTEARRTEPAITSIPAATTADPDILHTTPSETEPSFQQLTCTVASVTNSLGTCPPLQPNTDTSSALATKVASTLLDDNHVTCIRPFQFDSQLHMSFDIKDTRASSLFNIQVTGEGLHCSQPSTVVHLDLAEALGPTTTTSYISKQECPFEKSSYNAHLVTCTYNCHALASCEGSVRFGVEVKRISWLANSQRLEQLCDIRAFAWM